MSEYRLLTFSKITIFGAGTMGSGIAQTCAAAGCTVALCDPSPDAIKRAQKAIDADLKKGVELKKLARDDEQAIRARIKFVGGLGDCGDAELVIEAIFERLDAKHGVVFAPRQPDCRRRRSLPPTPVRCR